MAASVVMTDPNAPPPIKGKQFVQPPVQPPRPGPVSAKAPPPPPKAASVQAEEKEKAEPELQLLTPPKGAKVFYGGRPVYIGADVWYIHTDPSGQQLEVKPAKLFIRNKINPDLWTLNVYFFVGGTPMAMHDVNFSAKPKHGCWCWPNVPVAPKSNGKGVNPPAPDPEDDEEDTGEHPTQPNMVGGSLSTAKSPPAPPAPGTPPTDPAKITS